MDMKSKVTFLNDIGTVNLTFQVNEQLMTSSDSQITINL